MGINYLWKSCFSSDGKFWVMVSDDDIDDEDDYNNEFVGKLVVYITQDKIKLNN